MPDGVLDLLLYAALSASSKSDFQQASMIKVKDAAKRAAIARHFPSMPWMRLRPHYSSSAATLAGWIASAPCAITLSPTLTSRHS